MTTASEVRPRETIAATTIRAMSNGIEVVVWMSSVVGKCFSRCVPVDGIASNAGGYALSCTSKMSQNNTFMNGFYIIDIWHDVFVALNVSKKSVLRRELLPVLFVPSVFGNGNYHNYRSGGGGWIPCSRFGCCCPLRRNRDWICRWTRRFRNVSRLVPAVIYICAQN